MKKRKTATPQNDQEMSATESAHQITDEPRVQQGTSGTAATTSEAYAPVVSDTNEEPDSRRACQPRSAVRMSQDDRLRYMVPVYVERLKDTIQIMTGHL